MHRFIQVDTTHRYRYWRYCGPTGSYCDIAEFELYRPEENKPVRNCRIIGTLQIHPALPQSTANKAFDGDWLTNFSCAMADNALLWLRNHTRGEEERNFTYENGEQIWW